MNHTNIVKAMSVTVMTLSLVGTQVLGGEPQDDVPIRETAENAVETTLAAEAASAEPLVASAEPKVQKVAVQETNLEVKNQVPYVSAAFDPEVQMKVFTYFSDIPEMIAVAECESTFRHYNADGTVLRGRAVSSDIGVMQINEYYHGAPSQRLGYDIYTLEGNLHYARYLYETQGLQPWSASRPCWSKKHATA